MKKSLLILLFALGVSYWGWGQTQLAAWTFDATPAAPNTPSSVAANLGTQSGTAFIYADGTNGSSTWITATSGNELTAFAGSTVNDPRPTPLAGMAYCPVAGTGMSANGKFMVIKLSMTGYQDPILTYATRNTSTGFSTQTWAWSTDNITYTNFGTITGLTTTFAAKTLDMSSIISLDQASTIYLRITFTGATNATGNNRLDNIVINATAASAGGPTKLAITAINNGTSPSANTPFNVVVQSQDASNVPANVTANTDFTLSVATGTGSLGGTLTGTITAGTNSATVTGVTYTTAEAGVSITATRTSGDVLSPGTSALFAVLAAADHLAFVNVPSYGLIATNLNTFTVEARRPDNTVDANYISNITVLKASGSGNLTGTTVKTPVNGIATFNDLQFDAADTYTLNATSGTLTSASSGNIEIVGAILAYRSIVSGNWNNKDTWEGYTGTQWIPSFDWPVSSTKDVTIRTGHVVIVPTSYNLGTAKNLTIESGATLYANASSGSCFVYIYGDIQNDGTIGGATDVIGFDIEGTSCQLYGSGSFIAARIAKFTVANATTNFNINQNVTLTYTSSSSPALRNGQSATTTFNIILNAGKQLTVQNARIDLTGCTLTIKSDASLLDNGTIVGSTAANTTVERNYTGNEWHLISSPVSGATANMFLGLYLQNHTESTNSYTDISNPADPLNVMQGYALWNNAAGTASFVGTLNTGTMPPSPFILTRSGLDDPDPSVDNYGWNLVGNPYPSSIDWSAASGWTKTNVDNATYIHVNAATWATYINGAGLNNGSRYIASGQGFFVHVPGPTFPSTGALQMTNSVRVHNNTTFFKDEITNMVRLEVSGNGYADETVIRFVDAATPQFDGDWDALKLFGIVDEAAQIYSLGSNFLSINALPECEMVSLGMKVGVSGSFTIAATELLDLPVVILEDKETGIFTDLKTNTYTFNFTAGQNDQRFIIHFTPLAVGEIAADFINIYSSHKDVYVSVPANTNGDIVVYNLMGQEVTRTMITNVVNKITLNKSAYYVVKVLSNENVVTKKVFVK